MKCKGQSSRMLETVKRVTQEEDKSTQYNWVTLTFSIHSNSILSIPSLKSCELPLMQGAISWTVKFNPLYSPLLQLYDPIQARGPISWISQLYVG